ncbi:hypothetical protein [Thermovibrio ammonificans]|uniref:Uncharacterized protein n=1 Tax=Thermovibrio ammonificans (strain DSM 15698 / JCM 12110 / HB-1) TaxID=648996 RepID=E8T1X4_THEA1|nr:hypothetical protein [Thermovibrio ammonificans]ADU96869.1 hypothetical protein Theam_0902 [Thermovibrio ammonificans HB-1]
MRWFVFSLALLLPLSAYGEIVDPFVNPIQKIVAAAEAKLEKQKEKPKKEAVTLFKPVLPNAFNTYAIQGVVRKGNQTFLVVMDPQTGQVFFLKPGSAVAPDTKLVAIEPDKLIFEKYYRFKGRIVKKRYSLKVNLGG